MAEEVLCIHKAMTSCVDVTFDCVGLTKTMTTALDATRAGGKVCLIGLGQSEIAIPIMAAATTR